MLAHRFFTATLFLARTRNAGQSTPRPSWMRSRTQFLQKISVQTQLLYIGSRWNIVCWLHRKTTEIGPRHRCFPWSIQESDRHKDEEVKERQAKSHKSTELKKGYLYIILYYVFMFLFPHFFTHVNLFLFLTILRCFIWCLGFILAQLGGDSLCGAAEVSTSAAFFGACKQFGVGTEPWGAWRYGRHLFLLQKGDEQVGWCWNRSEQSLEFSVFATCFERGEVGWKGANLYKLTI